MFPWISICVREASLGTLCRNNHLFVSEMTWLTLVYCVAAREIILKITRRLDYFKLAFTIHHHTPLFRNGIDLVAEWSYKAKIACPLRCSIEQKPIVANRDMKIINFSLANWIAAEFSACRTIKANQSVCVCVCWNVWACQTCIPEFSFFLICVWLTKVTENKSNI